MALATINPFSHASDRLRAMGADAAGKFGNDHAICASFSELELDLNGPSEAGIVMEGDVALARTRHVVIVRVSDDSTNPPSLDAGSSDQTLGLSGLSFPSATRCRDLADWEAPNVVDPDAILLRDANAGGSPPVVVRSCGSIARLGQDESEELLAAKFGLDEETAARVAAGTDVMDAARGYIAGCPVTEDMFEYLEEYREDYDEDTRVQIAATFSANRHLLAAEAEDLGLSNTEADVQCAVNMGAAAIAWGVRSNMYPPMRNKGREYVIASASYDEVDASAKTVDVRFHDIEDNVIAGADLSDLNSIDIVAPSPGLLRAGGALVVAAKLGFAQRGHHTGGPVASGPVAKVAAMGGIFSCPVRFAGDALRRRQELLTRLIYRGVHAMSARAVLAKADPHSRISVLHVNRTCPAPVGFEMGSLLKLRSLVTYANTAKFNLAAAALRKVCGAGMAAFLPWANELSEVIGTCKSAKKMGARCHPGAAYLVDEQVWAPGSDVAAKLPELAAWIQTISKRGSLRFSPILSPSVADQCDPAWASIIATFNELKVNDSSKEAITAVAAAANPLAQAIDTSTAEGISLAAQISVGAAAALREL